MNRIVVDTASDGSGRLLAASIIPPPDGRSHETRNMAHVFDGKRWTVLAKWTGWEITSLAAGADFVVCASIKGFVYFIRRGIVEPVLHPEPDRALHCQFATESTLYLGGSTGYYLTIDRITGAISAHNLRHLGVEKPGRDIFSIQALKGGLLLCGANRLLLELSDSLVETLVPAGPTAGGPNLVGAAVLGDTLYAASHGSLWQHRDGELHQVALPPEVHSQVGFLTAAPDRILTGAQALYSIKGDLEYDVLFQHPSSRAYLSAFANWRSLPIAVYSDGTVLEIDTTIRHLPGILQAAVA